MNNSEEQQKVFNQRLATSTPVSRRHFLALGAALGLGACASLLGCATEDTEDGALPAEVSVGTIPASAQKYDQVSRTLFVFDTVVTIAACCSEETLDQLCQRCEYFEEKFSRTIPTSDVGRINAAGGKEIDVAPETADIISKALTYCEASKGLFDITIGAASSLWDFKEGIVPDANTLAEAVTHINYHHVSVNGTRVQLADPEAKLDLGGIAKGYIADDLCGMLAESGCDSGYVNLGGNVKTVGLRPDGQAWNVGIQDPNDIDGAVVGAVTSQGTSIVTSGLYEREFTDASGAHYWHILDPRTGYPVETDVVSATIISSASLDGDGYTKLLFFSTPDEALAWVEQQDGLEGIIMDRQGNIEQTSGCNATIL